MMCNKYHKYNRIQAFCEKWGIISSDMEIMDDEYECEELEEFDFDEQEKLTEESFYAER